MCVSTKIFSTYNNSNQTCGSWVRPNEEAQNRGDGSLYKQAKNKPTQETRATQRSYERTKLSIMRRFRLHVYCHYMVNGLLSSTLSSTITPNLFTLQSLIYSFIHIHTPTVVSYVVAIAALGQTNRSEATIQSARPGPLTIISRQGG
ncbi:hypothetical protein CHARACLAT_033552 [Characodon lateralis]|uniref:Uncharacterized protein n=1 Tax=Characodon lateralis TaxID=208331 RepID=A0ABU7F862_9TELE|nr:hypothetical protein [Characodon lateralis]